MKELLWLAVSDGALRVRFSLDLGSRQGVFLLGNYAVGRVARAISSYFEALQSYFGKALQSVGESAGFAFLQFAVGDSKNANHDCVIQIYCEVIKENEVKLLGYISGKHRFSSFQCPKRWYSVPGIKNIIEAWDRYPPQKKIA